MSQPPKRDGHLASHNPYYKKRGTLTGKFGWVPLFCDCVISYLCVITKSGVSSESGGCDGTGPQCHDF
jgi:hypothetical protein